MFGKRVRLFTLLGFEVRVDLSWLLLGVLIVWSLAVGLFPYAFPGLGTTQYWVMGFLGLLGLAFSIVVHEFCHALVARRYGMPISGITLFIFGGVAEMEEEPPTAKSEFLMAIAGPLASVVLAFLFYQLWSVRGFWASGVGLAGVVLYLGYLNMLLAVFNMLPAFPLDGGRVLRSILWGLRGDLHWATRWASSIGAGFGWALIGIGIWSVFANNLIGGLWWVLIGFFLRTAARTSYRQLLLRDKLRDVPVSYVMDARPVSAAPSDTLDQLMQGLAGSRGQPLVPVVEGGQLVGCVEADRLRRLPRDEWGRHQVSEYAAACPTDPSVTPESTADHAFSSMARRGMPLLVITVGGRFEGLLALTDVMRVAGQGQQRYWKA